MANTPEWASTYLADPSDLADILGVDAKDRAMLRSLRRVSGRFRGDVEHDVRPVDEDTVTVSGQDGIYLMLPARPIREVLSVEIDGKPVTDYRVGARTGILQRDARWPTGLENVTVTYSHGFEEIPEDIQDVILEAAEVDHSLMSGVTQVATGAESISFTATVAAGGSTERWRAVVDKYRTGWGGDRA